MKTAFCKLFQSLAILEYLDEVYPEPPLSPADPVARVWVRGFALINVADSHPLIVPRVRHYLTDVLKVSDDQRLAWIQHWLGAGLQAMETLLAEHPASGRFCHGETPTIADICLVTQVTPRQPRKQAWVKPTAVVEAPGPFKVFSPDTFTRREVGSGSDDINC